MTKKVWLVEMRDHEQAPWEGMFTRGEKIGETKDADLYVWRTIVYTDKYRVSECKEYAQRAYGEDFNPYCFRATEVEFNPEIHVIGE